MPWRTHHNTGGSMSHTPVVPEKTGSNNRLFLCRTLYVSSFESKRFLSLVNKLLMLLLET